VVLCGGIRLFGVLGGKELGTASTGNGDEVFCEGQKVDCYVFFKLFSNVFLLYTWYTLYNKTCNNIYIRKKLADLMFVYSWTAGPRSTGVLNPVTCPVETGVPVLDLVKQVLMLCSNSKF